MRCFLARMRKFVFEQSFMHSYKYNYKDEKYITTRSPFTLVQYLLGRPVLGVLSGMAISPLVSSQALEEVVVTAQKREQSVQEVPVAVTAYTAENLRDLGVTRIEDLSVTNPSFYINPQNNKVSVSGMAIRGVATAGVNPAFEGSVGVYIDGVYRSRPGMAMSTFNDIGTLEILRGPQGTLFGKNNTAGALVLSSARPTKEFESMARVELGNYDKQKFSGYVSGAINDGLLMRFSALSDKRDGFVDNPFTGNDTQNIDTQSYKYQVEWQAADRLDLRVIADYTEMDELCCYGRTGRVDPEGDRARSPSIDDMYASWTGGAPWYTDSPANPGSSTGDTFERNNANNVDGSDESEDWGVVLDLNYDIGDSLALRSVTAYRDYTNEQKDGDWDFGPDDFGADYDQLFEFETFSQEFSLSGNMAVGDVTTDYVLGLYYSKEDLHYRLEAGDGEYTGELFQFLLAGTGLDLLPADVLSNPGTLHNNTAFDQDNEVAAVFGHFIFGLTDSLNLVIGARYSDETKDLDRTNLFGDSLETYYQLSANQVGWMALGANTPGVSRKMKIEEEEPTWTLGLQYFTDDDTQIYGTYSRGFKSGGIDMLADAGGGLVSIANLESAPTTPEEVILTSLTDPSYSSEIVDAYELGIKTDYMDGRGRLNVALFYNEYDDIQFVLYTGSQFVTQNAESSEVLGIEIENSFAISDHLTSQLSVTYLDKAEYSEDDPSGNEAYTDGQRFNRAPDWAAHLGLQYEREIVDGITGYGIQSLISV